MEKNIVEANRTCDGAIHFLVQYPYHVRNEVISFHKFLSLCFLLVKIKDNMTEKLYHVEKNCGDILVYISSVVQKKY